MNSKKYTKTLIAPAFVFTIIVILTVYWISKAPKRALEKQIIAMQGMPVNLHMENVLSIIGGIDSTYVPLHDKKLIVFVDSTSCTGCFIGKLIEYFDLNDTLKSKSAQLVVILDPKEDHRDDIIERLHHEKFPFWCIVDSIGEFIKKNPDIPDNLLLHTFTLDEDNKIILVGDPSRNQNIRHLLLKVIKE